MWFIHFAMIGYTHAHIYIYYNSYYSKPFTFKSLTIFFYNNTYFTKEISLKKYNAKRTKYSKTRYQTL